jgi:hypothetical protein
MSKHTPGPWNYDRMLLSPNTKDRRCGFVINGPDVQEDDLPTRICDLRVPRGVSGFAEGEANARLIAAAPELLSALEALAKIGEGGTIQINETGKPTWNALDAVKEIARAAIAKAAGLSIQEALAKVREQDLAIYQGAGHGAGGQS